jgi:glucosylceramidase
MRSRLIVCLLICACALAPAALRAQKNGEVQLWLTNTDKSALFEQQKPPLRFSKSASAEPPMELNDLQTFQTIDGFGFALAEGSAQLLAHMDAAKRAALLKDRIHELPC